MDEPIRERAVCIIREYYEVNPPPCEKCGLRRVCQSNLTEEQIDRVRERINRNMYRREFWEDLNEFYDDDTYSEV